MFVTKLNNSSWDFYLNAHIKKTAFFAGNRCHYLDQAH
ncbi:hypothetical protein BPUTEOMOX_2335 [methanotrophic endosymbiont of Bathymodiolus puteoserpentis (Logatchev)]|nr:hypothetical protein BPUTEOMOX_2335 [methanotrophic endosymbiont of Bathymodiolus puteoserpentis (Logatchev)]